MMSNYTFHERIKLAQKCIEAIKLLDAALPIEAPKLYEALALSIVSWPHDEIVKSDKTPQESAKEFWDKVAKRRGVPIGVYDG